MDAPAGPQSRLAAASRRPTRPTASSGRARTSTALKLLKSGRVLDELLQFIFFIHSFIYFDSGGMAHKNNRQITIDNTRKYRKTDRHILDRCKRTDRDNMSDQVLLTCLVSYMQISRTIDTSLLLHKLDCFIKVHSAL